MKFTTITTAAAMQKMNNFIIACPSEKLTYAKKRFSSLDIIPPWKWLTKTFSAH
jgi:hypothetical protein